MSDFEVGIKCCWEQHTFLLGETGRKCNSCQKVMTISAWEEKRRCRCGSTNTVISVARNNSVSSTTTRINITRPLASPPTRINNQPSRSSGYSSPSSSTDRSRIRFTNSPNTIPEFNIEPWHYFLLGVTLTSVVGGLCWLILRPTTSPTPNNAAPIPAVSVSSVSPTPSTISPSAVDSISKEDAVSLVRRWLNARSQMFAPPYNQEVGKDLATGKAYSDKVRGPSTDGTETSTLEWLKKYDYYYRYNNWYIGEIKQFQQSGNDFILDLVIAEDKTQYDSKRKVVSKNSGKSKELIRYRLRYDSDKWKIADIEVLQSLEVTKKEASHNKIDKDPRDTVRDYYSKINKRDYSSAWNALPTALQNNKSVHPNGYSSFLDWWENQVTEIDIQRTNLISQTDRDAVVDSDIKYLIRNKRVLFHVIRYYLTKDDFTHDWIIQKISLRK